MYGQMHNIAGIKKYESVIHFSVHQYLDNELDWDSRGVDDDLSEIARYIPDWKDNLAEKMGLTKVEIHDIPLEYSTEQLQRYVSLATGSYFRVECNCYFLPYRKAALQKWKQKQTLDATYRNLLKLFVAAGHNDGAQAVCGVLNARKK